jgi:hypothetical protein
MPHSATSLVTHFVAVLATPWLLHAHAGLTDDCAPEFPPPHILAFPPPHISVLPRPRALALPPLRTPMPLPLLVAPPPVVVHACTPAPQALHGGLQLHQLAWVSCSRALCSGCVVGESRVMNEVDQIDQCGECHVTRWARTQ